MVGYYFKARGGKFELIITARPCNGSELMNSETIPVSGKREARKICKERGVQPWNF